VKISENNVGILNQSLTQKIAEFGAFFRRVASVKACQPPLALCVFALFSLGISQNVCAGKLGSFENDVSKTAASKADSSKQKSADDCGENCMSNFITMLKLLGSGIVYGGAASLAQVNLAMNTEFNIAEAEPAEPVEGDPLASLKSETAMPLRNMGSALLPFVRFDGTYQRVSSDVKALDYRMELGYGPAAIHFDQTRFKESNPDDTLKLTQGYALYRMSFGTMVEFDIGLGGASLSGTDTHRNFSWTLPLRVQPMENVGIEFRPAWVDSVSDYDLAVLLHYHYTSLKVGYRWLVSGAETLSGPYAGLSVHY